MKSLLDPTFRYTPSAETDIRKTFARVRREMRQRQRVDERPRSLPPANLAHLYPERKRVG